MIAKYYRKYDEYKGTQFVFSDLSTYKPGEWNVYSEIKRKLIEDYGIPAHEIRFIQECKTDRSRKALIQAMNDGDVRVLFGSTQMLGTGVNAQQRVVCIHHLDIPWVPKDLEQRDGRGQRHGNEVAKLYAGNNVDIQIYAVEKTLDSYKFNLLQCKATFISQLKTGALGARTIDEGAMDEKNGMNFSEYMAILSGNTDLLEKSKLEKRIAALESERKSFNKGIGDSRFRLQTISHDITNNEAVIKRMKEDYAKFSAVVQRDSNGNPVNNLTLDDCKYKDEQNMGVYLQGLVQKTDTHGQYRRVGEVYGFPICIISERNLIDGKETVQNRFVVEGNSKYVCVNISVQNFRDRSILFNPENLSAIGYRHPKKKKQKVKLTSDEMDDPIYAERSVRRNKKDDPSEYDETVTIPFEVELLSFEEYDRIVRKKQQWQSFWAALGEGLAAAGAGYSSSSTSYYGSSHTNANAHAYGNVGGVYGYANAYGSSYTTAYGQSHTTNYNGLAQYAANQQARANMAELSYSQNQIRQQIGDGYVKMHTIPAETEYSGFFNVKYNKKMQGLTYTIVIDGEPYTFYF